MLLFDLGGDLSLRQMKVGVMFEHPVHVVEASLF